MAVTAAQAFPLPAPDSSWDARLETGATVSMSLSLAAMLLFSLAQASLPVFVSYLAFGALGLGLARLFGSTERRLFAVVYGLSSIAAIGIFYYYTSLYGVPYLLGGSDELHYEEMGLAFAELLGPFDYINIRGTLVAPWHNSVAYIYVVGLVDKFAMLFGEAHTLVPRLFNTAALGLTAVGVYRIAFKLGMQRPIAIACALFAGCLPLMMYVSVQTLRDVLVSALLVALVVTWTPDRNGRLSIPGAAFVTLLVFLALIDLRRAQAAVALLIAAVGFLSTDIGRRPVVWALTFLTGLVAAAGVFLVFSDLISTDLLFFLGQADYYNAYRVDETGGGLSSVVFTTPPPLGWVLRTVYALVSPIPEANLELDRVWLSLGTLVHIMFIPFMFAGLAIAVRRREARTVLGAMVLLFVGMAMFTFQGRHIVQYLPFAIVLAGMGYERHRAQRVAIFAATAAAGATLAFIYLLLKL
jgi:hypothetical protein